MGQDVYDIVKWFPAEILEMIFGPLSLPDLLKCSVVSKNWRAAIRSVLSERRKFFAYVNHPCVDFVKLNDMMGKPGAKIINGLHIRITPGKCSSVRLNKQNLQEDLSQLLNWPFHYLHIEDYYEYSGTLCGAVIQLIQKMFWASRVSLVELAIKFSSISPNFFNCPKSLRKCEGHEDRLTRMDSYLFPKLKSIEFVGGSFPSDSCFHSFVLDAAPNFLEIKGIPVGLGRLKFWNENAIRRLKCVTIQHETVLPDGEECVNDETFTKLVRVQPRLHCVKILDDIESHRTAPFPSSWFDPLAQILRNSRYTLNQLNLCASELMKFVSLEGFSLCSDNIRYFPHVKVLQLRMPWVNNDTGIHRSILRQLNIGTNFPTLKELEVKLAGCQHKLAGGEYDMYGDEKCTQSDLQIKLYFTWSWDSRVFLAYFLETFPLLTSLQVGFENFFLDFEQAYSFSGVFSSFKHMRKLHLEFCCARYHDYDVRNFSLDAIFRGINFEEAERLRSDSKNNGLELRGMEIVPVRAGLTSASSLEFLLVDVSCCTCHGKNMWLSKIGRILAFDNMPGLEVVIEGLE